LLLAYVFLLLLSYYLVKVAREPLILTGGGPEVKTYIAAGQSILLVPITKAYAEIAERVPRMRLIAITTLFFASNLVVFFTLSRFDVPLGIAFFLWVGIFNNLVIAQFWSFASDIYDPDEGKRLFPILGIGSSVGAVAGSAVARGLLFLGPYQLMLVAGAVLCVCLLFAFLANRREATKPRARNEEPLRPDGGFALLLHDRYLLLIAVLILLLNCVNTTGEYIVDRVVVKAAEGAPDAKQYIGAFKANYLLAVNVLSVTMQLFAVSRIVKYIGVRRALVLVPFVSLTGYAFFFALPWLAVAAILKVAENAIDYSLGNTLKQALWLVTSREAKYKTKAVIDTFIVRSGDVLSAGIVLFGSWQKWNVRTFALLNVGFVVFWVLIVRALAKEHFRRAPDTPQEGQPAARVSA
jgi:AAA family ATP:ADP antiporter